MKTLISKLFVASNLVLLLLLASCQNQHSGQPHQPSEAYRDETRDTLLLQKKIDLATQMQGKWVSDDYLSKIARSKSIYAHRKYTTQLLGFDLYKENLLSNEPYMAGFTEVEGGYRNYLLFDRNKTCFLNDLNKHNVFPSIPKTFDLLLNGENIEMHFPIERITEYYRKIDASLDTELRKIVATGSYLAEGDSIPIVFTKEGQVNFLDFSSYKLVSNFGEGVEFDAIVFFNSPNPGHWYKGTLYKFEFQGRKLILHKIIADWATYLHDIVPEEIVLVKQ